MSTRIFRDDLQWVVVETGQPEQPVKIGTGATLGEARAGLQPTPIQSAGPSSGPESATERALAWANHADWIGDPEGLVENE